MHWSCASWVKAIDHPYMLVIYNAKIHTQDYRQPTATAIAIDHGLIVAIGREDEILHGFPASDQFDAGGHTIIPGLSDAHIHLETYALALQKVDCETPTRQECLERVAELAIRIHPGEWILGHGWNQNDWEEGYGSAALLDDIAPHNPVYLTHKSLHSAWANSMALQLAGITGNTPNPKDGIIGHLLNGEPDGILYESAADIVEKAIPEPSLEQVVDTLRKALPVLSLMGLTGVHDFDGSRCLNALQVLHKSHELKLRVIKGIPMENLSQAAAFGLRSGFGDDILRIGPLKLFSDGALGPRTAAMLQPYEDDPEGRGILMMDAKQLFEYGRLAVGNGISLAVHAIGDRANREVLNAYAQLREHEHRVPSLVHTKLRHRIEHVQVVHPDDLPRFSQLDIIASMQPIHATSDMHMADRGWGDRAAYAYAWRSLLSNHAHLAFGSDAPVESPNPFWGIHAAITRRRADGSPAPQGWHPEQRLNVDEAIHGFTIGSAYAGGIEDRLGKLTPGYLADLLILDEDPYSCPIEDLLNIKPLATMVGGEWLHLEL